MTPGEFATNLRAFFEANPSYTGLSPEAKADAYDIYVAGAVAILFLLMKEKDGIIEAVWSPPKYNPAQPRRAPAHISTQENPNDPQ